MFVRLCPGCGVRRGALCGGCLNRFSAAVAFDVGSLAGLALINYDRFAQRVILAGKNGGRPDVLRYLGCQLGRAWWEHEVDHEAPITVSWVPASRAGRRDRGFDQGRILARAAASEIRLLRSDSGRPVLGGSVPRDRRRGDRVRSVPLLTRTDRRHQTGLPRNSRMAGPELRWAGGRPPARVVLIDDVVTTGSSLRAATDILRSNGVARVDALAAAAVG